MKLSSLLVAAALAATTASQQVKVLLLGDSITEITCWRTLVWNQLVSAGLSTSVDFVGSMNNLQGKCSRPAGFDPDHEGHSGWQAYDIARNNIVGWVQNTRPDIVQFMLGTNDAVIGQRSVSDIIAAYTTILGAIRAANPNAKIIIDKLIPLGFANPTIDSVNAAIPGWVQQHTTSQSPIVIADTSAADGFTTGMLEDGVHPNAQGDQFLASKIGPKLVQFVRDVQQGGGTGGGSSTTAAPGTSPTAAPPPSSSAPPTANCAGLWGQCGGSGWSGATCCSSGTCRAQNQWYSQCVN